MDHKPAFGDDTLSLHLINRIAETFGGGGKGVVMRGEVLRHHSPMTHVSLRCRGSCKVDVQPTVTNNKRPLCLIYQRDSAVIVFTVISSPELLILLLHVGNSSASAHSCRVRVDKTLCWFTAGARGAA